MLHLKKVACAASMAAGKTAREIADDLGVSYPTVISWMKQPEVIEHYRKTLQTASYGIYAKAMKVLESQMTHDNPWVAQGAARELSTRLHEVATGDSREVIIRIEGPTIPLGLPSSDIDSVE